MDGFGGLRGRGRDEALEDLWAYLEVSGPARSALKELRAPTMTQEQLAAEARVSQPLISAIEAGTRAPSEAVAGRIAEVLGVPGGTLQTAIRLGQLKAALEAEPGEGGPLTLQIVELLALVEEYVPPGEVQLELKEVLTNALTAAAARDKERLRELQAKEAAPKQVSTKGRKKRVSLPGKKRTRDTFGRKVAIKSAADDRPGRDRYGRRIHKPNAPTQDAAPEPRKDATGRLLRDSRGRVIDKINDPRRVGRG